MNDCELEEIEYIDEHTKCLIFQFFTVFMRCEYYLKELDYLKEGKNAQPNWKKFIQDLPSGSDIKPELDILGTYILENPPKKQIIKDKKLVFEVIELDEDNALKLNLYIRRIRNNLFHGGKYTKDKVNDRDNKLLSAGLNVLRRYLEILKEKFENL